MTIEELLKKSGDFGPAQLWLLSLFCIVNLLSSFHYFAQTFISLDQDNCTTEYIIRNVTKDGNDSSDFYSASEDGSRFYTLASEMRWTCDDGWKMALVQSTFFMGSVLGTLILGILADFVGRLPMLFTANLLAISGNIMTIYLPPSLWSLAFSRFVAGSATDTNFFMMYIIVMEYIRPEFRTFGLNLCIGIWYCIGCMVTPWLAVYMKTWRAFLLVISLPMVVIPASSLFMPESAQWLISRGRTDDAIKNFKKIALFNNKKLSPEFISQFKTNSVTYAKEGNAHSSLWGLFETPRLRKKTFILIFKTMVLTLCYDAMSRNINGLDMDPFLLFTITSASIFPSCLVILIFQDKIGRKAMAVFSILLTGVFNFVQGSLLLLDKDFPYTKAVIGWLGRFAVNIAYNSGTQYAAELIPTQVRGQGLAAIHVVGYGAAFFSPQILYLSSKWIATPEVILGSLSIFGAVFCVLLPETLNKSLPVTLEDGELFGENEGVWDFLKRKEANKLLQGNGVVLLKSPSKIPTPPKDDLICLHSVHKIPYESKYVYFSRTFRDSVTLRMQVYKNHVRL